MTSKRRATIYRRAAEFLADRIDGHSETEGFVTGFYGTALDAVGQPGGGIGYSAGSPLQDTFEFLFWPIAQDWSHAPESNREQVLALCLMAAIAGLGERAEWEGFA